jgi:DNA-binding NarL/FixJ family response regulator
MTLVGGRSAASTDAARCVSVVLGRFPDLLAQGLMNVLREDPSVNLLDSDLDNGELKRAIARDHVRTAIVDEAGGPSLSSCIGPIQPDTGIVVVAREPTVPYGMVLLAAGISCFATSASAHAIRAAVRCTAAGGCAFVSVDGNHVARRDRNPRAMLTQRQVTILDRISKGHLPQRIALELGISVNTVKTHTKTVVSTLHAPSKRDLVDMPVHWLHRQPAN